MPRNPGTGQYSKPIPAAVPNTTIASAPYNLNVDDVVVDLNSPRPVVAGGTGGSNAHDARANLQAEMSLQIVTNYDSHVFENGSFFSDTAATGSPVAGQRFEGICYSVPTGNDFFLEARSLTDSVKYMRRKFGGAWQPWVVETANPPGPVTISGGNPGLIIEKGPTNSSSIVGSTAAGLARWAVILGDASAETGGNAGSDFGVARFSDAGTVIDSPLKIGRANGQVSVPTTSQNAFNVFGGATIAVAAHPNGFRTLSLGDIATTTMLSFNSTGEKWAIGNEHGSSDRFTIYNTGGLIATITQATGHLTWLSQGIVAGAPAGGNMGNGTVNAQAVYDDSALLTCAGVQHLKTGAVDIAQWDALAPSGKHPVARKFVEMLGEGFDPRDPGQFIAKMKADGALPGMPTLKDWKQNEISTGEMISRLWLAVELLASAFAGAVDRIDNVEQPK